MPKDIILTPEGLDKLQGELEFLQTEKRREVAERIKEAREFGDISENSEYDDAKNEQARPEPKTAHPPHPLDPPPPPTPTTPCPPRPRCLDGGRWTPGRARPAGGRRGDSRPGGGRRPPRRQPAGGQDGVPRPPRPLGATPAPGPDRRARPGGLRAPHVAGPRRP